MIPQFRHRCVRAGMHLRGMSRGGAGRIAQALLLSCACVAILTALSGRAPGLVLAAFADGIAGTPHAVASVINRASPLMIAAPGIVLCFRAGIINIGAEGQIALGGAGAAWMALAWPEPGVAGVLAALAAAAACGAAWAALAAAIHLARQVHEVLVTLLLNFVALLLVRHLLDSSLKQDGAGFLQSPLLPRGDWLPALASGFDMHPGTLVGAAVSVVLSVILWRTRWGFAWRMMGAGRPAARYAGFDIVRLNGAAMLIAGALAGLAGGVEVLAVHRRLIEGFSTGFGFKAVAVALLAGGEPAAVIPAALLFGALEVGTLSMQRQVGLPSALVLVIEGATVLFVLVASVRRR